VKTGAGFDPAAPIVVRVECEVATTPDKVWELVSVVPRWPRWFRRVRSATLRGPLTPGTALLWQVDGLRISSILLEVEVGRTLAWTLRMMGGKGGMRWTLEPLPSGGTLVRLEESWAGALVWLLRGTLRRTLESSRREWLGALKSAAQSGSAEESGGPA
jgi:uncharacterized protein YndB with AHSA1/START domain